MPVGILGMPEPEEKRYGKMEMGPVEFRRPPHPTPPRDLISGKDVKFGHIMSKELADKLDAECEKIGGISRRALINILLYQHFEKKEQTPDA